MNDNAQWLKDNVLEDLKQLARLGDECALQTANFVEQGTYDTDFEDGTHMTTTECTDMLMDLTRIPKRFES